MIWRQLFKSFETVTESPSLFANTAKSSFAAGMKINCTARGDARAKQSGKSDARRTLAKTSFTYKLIRHTTYNDRSHLSKNRIHPATDYGLPSKCEILRLGGFFVD